MFRSVFLLWKRLFDVDPYEVDFSVVEDLLIVNNELMKNLQTGVMVIIVVVCCVFAFLCGWSLIRAWLNA